jgi:hypothetical protein
MEGALKMAYRIQLRRDTAANWTAANPKLAQGEAGYELDTGKLKIGDGVQNWNALSYFDDKETDLEGYATEEYVDNAISNIDQLDLSNISQDIIPNTDVAYDLGSPTKRFRDLYLSGSTIDLGGATIKADATTGTISFSGSLVYGTESIGVIGISQDGNNPVETYVLPSPIGNYPAGVIISDIAQENVAEPAVYSGVLDQNNALIEITVVNSGSGYLLEGSTDQMLVRGATGPNSTVALEVFGYIYDVTGAWTPTGTRTALYTNNGVTLSVTYTIDSFTGEDVIINSFSQTGNFDSSDVEDIDGFYIDFSEKEVLVPIPPGPGNIFQRAGPNTPIIAVVWNINNKVLDIVNVTGPVTTAGVNLNNIPRDISDLTDTQGLLGQGGGDADTGGITFDSTTISAANGADITIEAKDEDGDVNTTIKLDPEYAAVKLSAKSSDSRQFYEGEFQDYATGTWTTANGSATLSLTGATRFLDFINDDSEWRQAGDRETGEFSLDGTIWYQWPYSSSSSGAGQISVTFNDASFTAGDPVGVETFYLRWTNESYITVDQDDYSEVKIVGGGVGVKIQSTGSVNTEAGDSINFEAQRSINLQTINEDVRIRTNIYGSQKSWEFKTDGTLNMPDTGELAFYSGGTEAGKIVPSTSTGGGLQVEAQSDFEIKVTQGEGEEVETAIWSFEAGGDLVFPDGSIQTTAYTGSAGGTATNIVNTSSAEVRIGSNGYEIEFVGFISNGFGDDSGATLTVTEIISGTITDGMTIYGDGLPSEGWVLTFDSGLLPPVGTGGTGNYLLAGANYLISSQSFNNNVLVDTKVWTFGTDGILEFPTADLIGETPVLPAIHFPVPESTGGYVGVAPNGLGIVVNNNGWQFGFTGSLSLPSGGIIAEDVVTDNPTINLTPANPEAESQKLIIKGGGPTYSNTENGITINTYALTVSSGNLASFTVEAPAFAGETFYWWVDLYSPGEEFTPDNGEITLDEFGFALIEFTVNDDTVPLRIYVADTLYNAYANLKGAVSTLINDPESNGSPDLLHLHLTTGDLQETSIFLGTDQHNVRTKIDGSVELTSYDYDDEESYRLTLKNNVLRISSTADEGDEDLYIKAEDDLYLDALDDDIHLRANDDVRISVGFDFEEDDYNAQWVFRTSDGVSPYLEFPDGSYQRTAYAGTNGHLMFIDTNRTGDYTANGSADKPFKTFAAAIAKVAELNPTGTVPYTFVLMGCNINEEVDFTPYNFNFITISTTCRSVFNQPVTFGNSALKQLTIRNVEFGNTFTITGDGTEEQLNNVSIYNASFSGAVNISATNATAFYEAAFFGAVNFKNINYMYINGAQFNADLTVTVDDSGATPANGVSPCIIIGFNFIANNVFLTKVGAGAGFLVFQPHMARMGLGAGNYTIPANFVFQPQGCAIRGTWTNNGSTTIRNTSFDIAVRGTAPAYTGVIGGDRVIADSAPESSKGALGDKVGMIAADASYIYVCTANYTDGVADIWSRNPLASGTW